MLSDVTAAAAPSESSGQEAIALPAFCLISAQLLLVGAAIYQFHLVSHAFLTLLALAGCGFIVHSFLRLADRPRFFVLLSLCAILAVLGGAGAGILVSLASALIALAILPVRLSIRVALIALLAGALILLRGGWLRLAGFSESAIPIWPILGSMFMFRLIVYLYDRHHESEPPPLSQTLAYFFLLPNVCFPLFPVIDFKTFLRRYYDAPAAEIYQRGVAWMLLGISHLLLFRLVKYHLFLDLSEVRTGPELLLCFVSGYLLYLRVSGDFHLVCGLLHLFGFHLPSTHRWYFFAPDMAELARRINSSWSAFRGKIVFLPASSSARRWGLSPLLAAVVGGVLVWLASILFHAWQWFWIRGVFPLTAVDAVFWLLVDSVVLLQALRLLRQRAPAKRPPLSAFALRAASTAATFAFVCVMWSVWNSDSLGEWFSTVSQAVRRWR